MSTMMGVMNYSLIILLTSLYVATSRNFFHTIYPMVGKKTNDPLRLHIFFNRPLSAFTGCAHDLIPGSGLPSFFLVPGNTAASQSMLGTSSTDYGLVSQSTHWYNLWVDHTSPSNFTQDASPLHSIWITTFLVLITIPIKASSTGIHTMVITDTNISGSQYPCMLTFLTCLVGPPIKLTDGRITTGIGLYESIWSFMNITTGWCTAIYFTIAECADKDTSVDELSMSLSLHDSVDFCINTSCHTTAPSFLAGAILWIGTAIIWLATCVPRQVHLPTTQRFFSFHWNRTVPWTIIPTNNL